jgi:hypothetical protein
MIHASVDTGERRCQMIQVVRMMLEIDQAQASQ